MFSWCSTDQKKMNCNRCLIFVSIHKLWPGFREFFIVVKVKKEFIKPFESRLVTCNNSVFRELIVFGISVIYRIFWDTVVNCVLSIEFGHFLQNKNGLTFKFNIYFLEAGYYRSISALSFCNFNIPNNWLKHILEMTWS